jgi:nascent polypeptide-associated complex subunit alpha
MTKSDVEAEEYDENMSKGEIKSRKAMAKLGLKSVPEINRVVIRKANNSLFIIAQADVYKTTNGDSINIRLM